MFFHDGLVSKIINVDVVGYFDAASKLFKGLEFFIFFSLDLNQFFKMNFYQFR